VKLLSSLDKFPKDVSLHWISAEALLLRDEYSKARDQYLKVEQLLQEGNALPFSIEVSDLRRRIGECNQILAGRLINKQRYQQAIPYLQNSLTYYPSASAYLNLAFALVQVEALNEAREVIAKGLNKYPADDQLLRLKGNIAFAQQDYPLVNKIFAQLYEKNPDDLKVALAYAEGLMANQRADEAMKIYEKLLEQYPREKQVYDRLLATNRQYYNTEGTLEVLKRMQKAFPENKDLYLKIGDTHELLQQWEKARNSYRKAGNEPQAKILIAQSFIHQDSISAAVATFNELVNQYPDHEEILTGYAALMKRTENWKALKNISEKLLEISPANTDYLMLKATAQRNQQLLEPARQTYLESIEKGAENAEAYYYLARYEWSGTQQEAAFQHLKKAMEQAIKQKAGLKQRMMLEFQSGMYSAASVYAGDELEQQVNDLESIIEKSAEILSANYNFLKVNNALKALINQFPEIASIRYYYGNHLALGNRIKEAMNAYREAIKVDPEYRPAHLAMGRVEKEQGNITSAILAFERALSLAPEQKDAYRALIALYYKNGKLDTLTRKWLNKYATDRQNVALREALIEALHKQGEYEKAQEIINDKS
jgi:tetratricopeptide (TPR) repeat protein